MYLDEYKRWLAADLEDSDLHPELLVSEVFSELEQTV